jgi:hypothetical protein
MRGSRIGVVPALIAVVVVVALFVAPSYFKEETVTTEVISKERVCDSDSTGQVKCQYLVFTEAGTFKLTDSLVIGRFDSSDIYGRIREGRVYRITSYGWRFGCTSTYPNIKNLEEVK